MSNTLYNLGLDNFKKNLTNQSKSSVLLYIFVDIDIKLIYNFAKLKTRRTT